jgi:hypothetical protein
MSVVRDEIWEKALRSAVSQFEGYVRRNELLTVEQRREALRDSLAHAVGILGLDFARQQDELRKPLLAFVSTIENTGGMSRDELDRPVIAADPEWLDLADAAEQAKAALAEPPDDDPPVIFRMLDLSTAHVSDETRQRLDDGELIPAGYAKGEYGWFVPVIDNDDDHTPPELRAIMEFARKQNCQWLMFDRDADQIDGLATFDW